MSCDRLVQAYLTLEWAVTQIPAAACGSSLKPGRRQNRRGSHLCAGTRGRRCHATTHQDASHQRGLPTTHILNLVLVLQSITHQGNASQPLHQCVASLSVVGCCRCSIVLPSCALVLLLRHLAHQCQALCGSMRQHQAVSSSMRQYQAVSGSIRQYAEA